MKDEYDFSGGTRGKFYRPGAQVRLPYHRGSQSWLVDVALTGRWWQPEFWRDPNYVTQSPWSAERLESAFDALTKLYGEDEAKAAFSWVSEKDPSERVRGMERPLWRLLACPMRPDLSALLRLGFDAADAGLPDRADLVRRLRTDVGHEIESARFELRCLAAFRNAGIQVTFDPILAGKNPDFLLQLQDHSIYIEAKYAEEGEWAKEEQSWFWKLSMPRATQPEILERPINAHVRLTDKFQELQETEGGRSYLRANIDRLALEIVAAKVRLAGTSGPFPAIEYIEDLVEVKAMGTSGGVGSSSMIGVPTDARREVARVVRGAVARGAMQIPSGEVGLVLLNPGMHAPSHLLVEEVNRWMRAEGAHYSNLVGVLVLAEVLVEPVPGVLGRLEQVIPVWREETPRWVIDGPWNDLSLALAARDLEALEHRCKRAVHGDREGVLLAATG